MNRRVILLDLDGVPREIFKTAYIERRLPNFERILGRAGEKPGSALWFDNATTVFPSITLTGHASLFTGAYPSQHGIPGNQWFDRSTAQMVDYMSVAGIACVYGVPVAGGMDCRGGLANRDLLAPTIYQAATQSGKTTAVVFSEYWAGASRPIMPSLLEGLAFLRNNAFNFKAFDTRAMDRALAAMQTGSLPDLTTLYFAGPDGVAHESGTPAELAYLQNTTDPQIGRLLDRLEALDEDWRATTLFVITSDHGRTDVTPHPEDPQIEARISAALERIGYDPSRARLANNDGMAHLYLRSRLGDAPWAAPPRFEDTAAAARALYSEPALHAVVESIFVRRNGAYQTYGETGNGSPELSSVPDTALVQRLQSARSGDILILLKTGHYFHNTGKGSHHGSIHPLDLGVPLILAQGGIAPGWSLEPVSTVQVARTIADYLGIPMAGAAPSLIQPLVTGPVDNRRIRHTAIQPDGLGPVPVARVSPR